MSGGLLTVETWVEECCERDELARSTLEVLHDHYEMHARRTSRRFMSRSWFSYDLSRLTGVRKASDVNGWLGLKVRP